MASYTVELGLVKYYNESLDEYAVNLPLRILNSKDKTIYAKLKVLNDGNLNWSLDDNGSAVTEKSYQISQYSSLKLLEKIKTPSAITETTKDAVILKVEYYKDAAYTKLFGEDTITVNINAYIQNSDKTWGSTNYTDDQIVFEKWDFSGIGGETKINDGHIIQGVLGNAKMHFAVHWNTYIATGTAFIESSLWWKAQDNDSKLTFIDANGNLIADKIISFVIKGVQGIAYDKIVRLHYDSVPYYTVPASASYYPPHVFDEFVVTDTVMRKVISVPLPPLSVAIEFVARAIIEMDGVYIFNPL